MSYLDKTGLSHFFEKLKGVFAAKNHTHTKADIGLGNVDNVKQLPIAGGTMTGTLTLKGNQYTDAHSGALNANNSNIYGVNSIYTADASDNASEGIHFYRDATHVDTLWMNGGDLLFTPNRALAGSSASTSKANSEKVARLPATVTNNQFVLTDGTTGKLKTKALTSQDIARPTGLRGFDDPTLQSLVSKVRANRLAFLPGDQIIIEKTTDGGAMWVDAGVSDGAKSQIFSDASTGGVSLPLIDGVRNLKCGLRITITAMKYNVPAGTPETEKYNYWNVDHLLASGYQERYCTLKDFYFYISSAADSMGVKIERSGGKADHTWVTVFDDSSYYMTGCSGVDYVRIPQSTFGGGSGQTGNYWNYRFTFMTKGQNGTTTMGGSATQAQAIYQINAYGDNVWAPSLATNPLMVHDHMYSFDRLKNVTFPAGVKATDNFTGNLIGDVTGHASKDLALTGGTMTGALNFANATLNTVGDDAYFGDQNVAGMVAVKGKNGTTGIRMIAKDATGTGGASITWDGTDLSLNGYTVKKSVPSDAKFTDTTYTAATAAPGKVASASAQGTSTNYARQDHTHGIDVATGDANGQVKIAGQNASVKGLAALAYKASLTESDIPELNASKITAGTLPVSRGGTGKTTAKDAANDFMNALDTGSSTPADADYYISQYVNGGNTTKTYHRRPMSALWAYIQGKIQTWAKNLTAKGNLGWTDQTAGKIPVTNNTLAYWDGRYNASASNLTYCVKGAFGNLAVKDSLGKSDVGLGNVDNTSDTNKPVSTAQRKAIDDKVPLIISSQTTTTNHWTGEAPFASLEDGQTIRYHLVRDPTGTADLTLTLSGGTDTPAYPIYFNTFSRVTTHFAVGQIITMTFRTNVQRNATGTKYTGWFVNDYRDSDTVTRGMWDTSAAKVGSGNKVFGYSLFMEKADGTFESIALSGGTGTGKTKNSAGFRPGRIWYNESSTERASGAVLPYGAYYRQLDFRYSTNCAQTLTAQKPVYLVGEIIEGLFYIHDNNFIAQDLPTSEDGLAYMYLGGAYNTYCVALMPDHPIYIYQGGRIKRWLEGIRTINGVGAGEDGNIDLEVDDITGNLISGSKVVRSVNEISPDDSGNVNIHTGWHAYLVWENANPSATFAAQTISLNLSHFDWVLIEARHFEEGNTTGYSTMLCRKGQTTSLLVVSHSNNRDGTRSAIVTDTGVQFSVCTYNNGTNNNYGVPLRIYAISGTEATIAELVKEYIFNNGSFAAPLVNSWGKVGNVATMTVTDGVITMKSTSTDTSTVTRPAYGYATTPIDLTNYKEFRARVKVKGKKGGAIGFSAAVPTSVANDVSSCGFAAYSQPTNSTATYEGWISVDISALSGNHYLGMWATGYHVSGSTSSPVGTVLIYEAYLIPNDE